MRPEAKALRSVLHHGLLADQLGEDLGPVFPRERRVALGCLRAGRRGFSLSLGGTLGAFLVFGVGHTGELSREGLRNLGGVPRRSTKAKVGGWTSNPRNAR